MALEERVLLRGQNLPPAAIVTGASVDLSTSEASEATFNLVDENLALLSSGVLTRGATVDVDDLRLELTAYAVEPGPAGTGALSLTCRPRAVRSLSERRGPLRMTGVSAATFVLAECNAAGVPCVVQEGPALPEVARDADQPDDSTWSTFTRLATEVGTIVFEAAGVVYFAQPTWLLARSQASALAVGWFTSNDVERALALPQCRASLEGENDVEISVTLPAARAQQARPGGTLRLYGMPAFSRDYLITRVGYDLLGGDVSVTAAIPRDPVPQPRDVPERSGPDAGAAPAATGQGTASAFVDACLSQQGKPYVWGAEVGGTEPGRAYDCSELVEWAVRRVGGSIPDGSGNQINHCARNGTIVSVEEGMRTRGALLWHQGHIAVSLGNGRTIEAANRKTGVASLSAAGRFTRAGRVPGLRY